MNNKGILIILSGPSGSGKGTVLRELLKSNDNIKLSISATTRSPRNSEKDGKDYYFISKAEFVQLLSKNEVLEHAEYCDNYYGTPKKQVDDWLNKGRDVLLEIEVNGAAQVKNKCPNSVSIFILPPSLKVLRERLVARETECNEVIEKRLYVAEKEIQESYNYDYVVINDSLDECVKIINDIINKEKLNQEIKNATIREVIKNV